MFQQSRQKRQQILQQLTDKRERMTSVQRRRQVEDDYNNFLKTMNNIKPSVNNSQLKLSSQNSQNMMGRRTEGKEEVNLTYSPTIGSIPKPPTDRQSLNREFYQNYKDGEGEKKEGSAQKVKQVNFYQPSPNKNVVHISPQNLSALNQQQSEQHSQVKEEEIHPPKSNPSIPASSVNNSQAIFFTSQFKQFLDRDPLSPPKEVIKEVKVEEGSAKVEEKSKEQQDKAQKTLKNNRSGNSLVLSNDSSLKFSLGESAVHEAIAKKLSQELVVDSLGDSRFAFSVQNLAVSLLIQENSKDFIELSKQVRVAKAGDRRKKQIFFEELMIQRQLQLESRKNKIKLAQFQEQKRQQLLKGCLSEWNHLFGRKNESIELFVSKRNAQTVHRSFKALKMLLYDRKINNQIHLYYLSKIFFNFKSITQKQAKLYKQKAYSFYFKNLKKRVFNRFVQGCYITKHENKLNQAAEINYGFNLMRKAFESWRQFMPVEERYVRLAMTTHIELRQTADKKLFQTRTFDFRELK